MPSRHRRYPRCHNCNKLIYPSQVVAEDMAAYRMSVDGPGHVISVYQCPVRPGKWHITKTNQLPRLLKRKEKEDG